MRFLFLILFLFELCTAQPNLFIKKLGGPGWDDFSGIVRCADGNFLLTGTTENFGAGMTDVYLVKMDSLGDTLWTRTYGNSWEEGGVSLAPTSDSGCIIVGSANGFSSGDYDGYVLRINKAGNMLWSRKIGNFYGAQGAVAVVENGAGDFVISCATDSFNWKDIGLITLSSSGNFLWSKRYGDYYQDELREIVIDTDDNIFGFGCLSTGPSNCYPTLLKFNSTGDTLWKKTYSIEAIGMGFCITPDRGFLLNCYVTNTSPVRVGLIKTDSLGNIEWAKTYNAWSNLLGLDIKPLQDGNFLLSGVYQKSNINHVTYLLKLNSIGDTIWTRTYDSGPFWDMGTSFIEVSDGFIISGNTSNSDGSRDALIIKTDTQGLSMCNEQQLNTTVSAINPSIINLPLPELVGDTIGPAPTFIGSGGASITLCSNVGLHEEFTRDLVVYPNPGNLNVNVSSRIPFCDATLEIYDSLGQKRLSKRNVNGSHVILERSDFTSGVYYIRISSERIVYSAKIIFQ